MSAHASSSPSPMACGLCGPKVTDSAATTERVWSISCRCTLDEGMRSVSRHQK
jgi:hypothetical protein